MSTTRDLGYRPVFLAQDPDPAPGGVTVSIIGTGFGADVTMKIGGKPVLVLNRIDDGMLEIEIPEGLDSGEQDLEITNVEAAVTLTIANAFNVAIPDDEELIQILRGERGGTSHPIGRLRLIDDAGDDVNITADVKRIEVVLRREDRRTALSRFVPPIQSADVTFKNDQKQFTKDFGGAFDGLLIQGREVIPLLGFKVKGINDFRTFGKFRIDDVNFANSPPAEARIQCRDLLSAALDQKISVRSFTGRGDEYIKEVLAKIGIETEGAASEISLLVTTTTFTATPVVQNVRALDVLSEVMAALQPEANYRLFQDADGIIKLRIIPFTGLADQAFHWKKDVSRPYNQKQRANQSSLRTTVTRDKDPAVTEDVLLDSSTLTEADFTGSPKQKTISFSKAIRIEWRAPGDLTQDFEVKEVARTPTSVTFEMVSPADTGTINLRIRGDTTSTVVGEAGSGEDQGGAGLGNAIDRKKRRRGQSREIQVRYVPDDAGAQAVADILQRRFGDPASEQEFASPFALVRSSLNSLVRIIEKFSESRNLHTISQLSFVLQAGSEPGDGDSLTGSVVALDAGIVEPATLYDSGFQYDRGLIYDSRFPIGAKDQEDSSFRGAVVRDLP
jgi:hypothetical protein